MPHENVTSILYEEDMTNVTMSAVERGKHRLFNGHLYKREDQTCTWKYGTSSLRGASRHATNHEGNPMTKYHPQEYDLTIKQIMAEVGLTIVAEFLGLEVLEHEILSLELISVEKRETDKIFKITTPEGEFILHLELQSRNDPEMARRMLDYLGRIHRQHVLPVLSVVLYLGSEPLRMSREVTFTLPGCSLQFQYTIITLNDFTPDQFLNKEEPNHFILAVLTSVDSPREILRTVLQKLRDSVPREQLEDYVLKLDVLCQLRGVADLLVEEVRTLSVEIDMKRLITYQLGKEEGLKEGKEEGLKEGKEEGLKEGILIALEVRFGREELIRRGLDQAIAAIDDLDVLDQLKALVRHASSVQEIQAFLNKNTPRER